MSRPTDISAFEAIAQRIEDRAEKLYLDLDTAVAEIARVFGPSAAAHALACATLEMAKLADQEASDEEGS